MAIPPHFSVVMLVCNLIFILCCSVENITGNQLNRRVIIMIRYHPHLCCCSSVYKFNKLSLINYLVVANRSTDSSPTRIIVVIGRITLVRRKTIVEATLALFTGGEEIDPILSRVMMNHGQRNVNATVGVMRYYITVPNTHSLSRVVVVFPMLSSYRCLCS